MDVNLEIIIRVILALFVLTTIILIYLYSRQLNVETLKAAINRNIVNYQFIKQVDKLNKKQSFLDKRMETLDCHLYQAGIKSIFKKLTPEMFSIYTLLVTVAVMVWTIAISGKIGKGLIFAVAFLVIVIMGITSLRYINRTKAEANLLETFNLMGQYAAEGEDLGIILFKTGASLPAPIGPALQNCYYEILSSGDTKEPMCNLRKKIDLDIFQQTFLLLEVCSRHSNKYKRTIDDGKNMVHAYLKTRKEVNIIIREYIFNFFVLIGLSFAAVYVIVEQVGERSIGDFFMDPFGKGVLVAYAAVFILFIYWIITFKGK